MALYCGGPGKRFSGQGFTATAAVLALALFPANAWACMPLVPLVQLYVGPAVVYAGIFGLIGGLLAKSAMFALFVRPLPFGRAFLAMLLANVVTTVLGVVLAQGAAIPAFIMGMIFIVLPVAFFPSVRAAKLLESSRFRRLQKIGPYKLTLAFTALYFLTFGIFVISADMEPPSYWPVKGLYVATALLVSAGLTVIWEEMIVWKLFGRRFAKPETSSFYPQVLAATVLILLLFMGIGAIWAIPERLASPNHLI